MLNEDSYVMYLVVPDDLEISPGKLGAQIGHAVQYVCEKQAQYCWGSAPSNETKQSIIDSYNNWEEDNIRKIVLKAKPSEWEKVCEAALYIVRDAGHTELEPGTETVAVFWPMKKSNRSNLIKRLKLL